MPTMDWKYEPLADSYRAFKARMTLFLEDQEITDTAKQSTKIKIALGDEGIRRVLNSGLSDNEQKDPGKLWSLIEEQVDATVKINFRVHRLEFSNFRQKTDENINDYVSRLREKAAKCEFEAGELNERLIESIILSTPFEDFRKDLLTKPKEHPIKDVIEKGREHEAVLASQASLNMMKGTQPTSVYAVYKNKQLCKNCGLHHAPRSCPAYRDECGACGYLGHWKKLCRGTARSGRERFDKRKQSPPMRQSSQSRTRRQTNKGTSDPRNRGRGNSERKSQDEVYVDTDEDTYDTDDDTYTKTFYPITVSGMAFHAMKTKEAFVTLMVHNTQPRVEGPLRLKLDTGAGGNTLPFRTYRQMFGETPTKQILKPEHSVRLTSYSGHTIPCMGSLELGLQGSEDTHIQTHKFYVVDVPGPAIIGLPSSQELGLIKLNEDLVNSRPSPMEEITLTPPIEEACAGKGMATPPPDVRITSVEDLKWWFPDRFDRIGCFHGEAVLHVKPEAKPHIDPPRRCSIHLRPKVEAELKKMEADGIIRKVTEHTDWCSSLTYALKQDGSLRICLDPKKLNDSLKRCPHKIPTIEEINPTFAKAKFFTKLDAKAGYWSVKLAEMSQELTTFRTPFGRWCFRRLPFGLSVSQDIFQQKMDDILDQCEGAVGISDDIVVCGETEAEHDRRLIDFMKVARKDGLVLNSSKCVVKTNHMTFFGRLYTDHGMFPDPEKVEDIVRMPTPQDKQDLQRFIGMVTFLSSHLPKLSDSTAILRDLLKENVPFEWSEDHHTAFQGVKDLVAANVGLRYYDPAQDVSLEVDASSKGLGAALVQASGPVAFASKTLTTAQSNYSNLERECLAIVHGIQRYHHYLFGRHFTIITDHKPLEMILRKPLSAAPPRLQRLLVKIQGYNYDIHYRPGPQMVLADALSRLPNQDKDGEIELDYNVESIKLDMMNFSPTKQEQLRSETSRDPVFHRLTQTIFTGWPNSIQELPLDLRSFWGFRDGLAVENGIIFKGKQVLVPDVLRADILKQLHEGHQGIEKTRRLARESVFWPGINGDIERQCKKCKLCQELQPQQPKQPMRMQEKPSSPWVKLGTDLFEIGQKNFLIISDYHSRYPVVKQLESTTAKSVISVTKEVFSLLGVPREIMSDNGPQFQREYNDFCTQWGIDHITSSPRYPQSNGFIERQIRYIKPILKKCLNSGGDINKAMLNVRATPLDGNLPSPAELMFGRAIPTALPSHSDGTKSEVYRDQLADMAAKQKGYADLHTRDQPPLIDGQQVRVLDKEKKLWYPATVVSQSRENDRSYVVETESGRHVRRNRVHLREIPPMPTDREQPGTGVMEGRQPSEARVNNVDKPPASMDKSPPSPSNPTSPIKGILRSETDVTKTRSGRSVRPPVRFIET